MDDRKERQERAEAQFKKKAAVAEEGSKAKAEYEAEAQATRNKTERLRMERLVREAAVSAIDQSLDGAHQPPEVRAERKKRLTEMPPELQTSASPHNPKSKRAKSIL